MLKHAACAAANSSSGFDPAPSSNRDENEYWPAMGPLAALNVPVPPRSPPSHTALAFLFGISRVSFEFLRILKQKPPERFSCASRKVSGSFGRYRTSRLCHRLW